MSNREDYLDSLLKSVTGPEETGRDAEAKGQRNQKGKAEAKRSVGPLSADDEFLASYDQELLDLDEDAFLKEFEEELAGKNTGMSGRETAASGRTSEDLDDLMVNTMDDEDFADVEYDRGLEEELLKGDGPKGNAASEDTFADGLFGEDVFMDSGFSDGADKEAADADDIDAMLKAAMNFGDGGSEAAPAKDPLSGEDPELMDILSGMGGNDDLEDIGNMLKAHDEDSLIEDDGFDQIAGELSGQIEELGVTSGLGLDPDFVKDMKEKKKNGKKKKKEKKPGVFSKLSSTLFDEKEESVVVPEANELGSVSEENMSILKELDKKEKKEKKKQEKLEKKQAKLEKKAQAKQEKPPKPPKEKKPKQKSKPLPRKPVVLIYVMAASILLLIFLGSSLSGYRMGIDQAKASYDNGDYVTAYQSLMGMELKEKDEELYGRTRVTAYVQKEWNSYQAYLGLGMYPEALDALILAVGKYDKYIEKATQVGADGELESVRTQVEAALTDVFGVTAEEARTVYAQPDRGSYTQQLYELLGRAGLAE